MPSGMRKVVPFAPTPIDVRLARKSTGGPGTPIEATGVTRVWITAEARRCRLCPPDLCTLKPIPTVPQIATCVLAVWGDVSADSAAQLRVD